MSWLSLTKGEEVQLVTGEVGKVREVRGEHVVLEIDGRLVTVPAYMLDVADSM